MTGLRKSTAIVTISWVLCASTGFGSQLPPSKDSTIEDVTCSNLAERLHSMEIDFDDSNTKLKRMESEADSLRNEEESLQSEEIEKSRTYESSKMEYDLLQKGAETARSDLLRAQKLASALDQHVHGVESQLEADRSKLRNMDYMVDSLQTEETQLVEKIRKDELKLQMFKTDEESSRQSVTDITSAIDKRHRKLMMMNASIDLEKNTMNKTESELEATNRRLGQSADELAAIRSSMSKTEQEEFDRERSKESLQRQQSEMMADIGNVASDLAARQHSREVYVNSSLVGFVSKLRDAQEEVTRIKASESTINKAIAHLPKGEVQPSFSKVKSTDTYLDELRNVVHENRAFLLKHGYNPPSLVQVTPPHHSTSEELHMKSQILLMTEASHGVRQQLDSLRDRLATFERIMSEKNSEIQKVEDDLATKRSKLHRVNETLSQEEKTLIAIRSKEVTDRANLEKIVGLHNAYQESFRSVSSKLKSIQTQLRTESQTVSHLIDAEQNLKSQLEQKHNELASLESAKSNLTNMLAMAHTRVKALDIDIMKDKNVTSNLSVTITQSMNDEESKKEALSNALADVAHIGKRLHEKLQALEIAQQARHTAETTLYESQQLARETLNRRSQLDMEIDSTTAIVHELSTHIAAIKRELEKASCSK